MNSRTEFAIGQLVYMKLIPEKAGMVTGILQRPTGVSYFVTWEDGEEKTHYSIELQEEKGFRTAVS